MMLKRSILLVSAILVFQSAYGQIMNGTVIGTVSLGTTEYCFISEDGTPNVYKSSTFNAGELLPSESVDLRRTSTENQVQVSAPNLTSALFAELQIAETGQSIYYPDMSRMPIQIGDILFFEDEAHITEVHDMMTLYLEDDAYRKENDVKLDEIEQYEYPSFLSYRTHFNNEHNLPNGEFTDEEIEDLMQADFINDAIHKTFFNKYRFMGVGSKIYYMHDINMTLVIDKNDTEALDALKFISTEQDINGYDVYDPNSISMDLSKIGRIDFLSPFRDTYEPPTKGISFENQYYYYQTIPTMRRYPCEFFRIGLGIEELNEHIDNYPNFGDTYDDNFWDNSVFTLKIDWGDGSAVQIINNYEGGNIIDHNYPLNVQTTYYPTITLSFINSLGTLTEIEDGSNTSFGTPIEVNTAIACTNANDQVWGEAVSGNWKITTKLWTHHDWLSKEIGSRTWAWKLQNNGSWKLKNSTIATFVSGNYRTVNCFDQETKSGNKHHNNDKKVQKTKNKLFANYSISNGDVTSYHTLSEPGVSIAMSLVLNPCQ